MRKGDKETRSGGVRRMFEPRFHELVRSGRKLQTIRPVPKRMPKVGQVITCAAWLGKPYRSKQEVLCRGEIEEVSEVRIRKDFVGVVGGPDDVAQPDGTSYLPHPFRVCANPAKLDMFAREDGFGCWQEMEDWFSERYLFPFSGILIRWKQLDEEVGE